MLNISKEVLRQDAVILKKIDFSQWIQHPNSFLTLYDRWLDIRGIYIPIEKGFLLFLEEFFELSSDEGFRKSFEIYIINTRNYSKDFSMQTDSFYFSLFYKSLIVKQNTITPYVEAVIFYPNGYCPDIEKLCNILEIDYSLFKTIFYGE